MAAHQMATQIAWHGEEGAGMGPLRSKAKGWLDHLRVIATLVRALAELIRALRLL